MARVAVIGLGGIGSHTVDLLGRDPEVESLVLVDPDVCEEKNLASQRIEREAIGRLKVDVHAAYVGRIAPHLRVRTFPVEVAEVPLGYLLDCDVLLGCLDSRSARIDLNRIAWRLNKLCLDAGVSPEHHLARISIYAPGAEQPCLLCSWPEEFFERLDRKMACGADPVRPSNAPASLGALAASLQVAEFRKVAADRAGSTTRRKIVYSLDTHEVFKSTLARNRACRFDHHLLESVHRLDVSPDQLTMQQALAFAGDGAGGALSMDGHGFCRSLVCGQCGEVQRALYLANRLKRNPPVCPSCGEPLCVVLLDIAYQVTTADAPGLDLPLSEVGFLDGDLLTVSTASSEKHFVMPTND